MADYIIVGGGPAGCAIAARLSEDASVRVTLLEAGGHDRHPLYHWPAGFAKMTKGIGSWGWSTVPQRHMQDRVLRYTQAKVIGGGSTINAQLYTRGNRLDYDEWAQAGCRGWAYEDVLPYFRRAEDNQRFSDDFHAYGGPIGVSMPVAPLPICDAFMRAAQELGIPYNHDFNGARQAGIGFYQLTQKNARRSSAATGYLGEAAGRANLTVRTGVEVLRIVVEKGRAVGVEIAENGGKLLLRAEREVIVSSGAIGSPRLLMLSGIGPAAHLKQHGIEVVADRPGVGQNLQDHLEVYIQQECTQPITLYSSLNLFSKARIGAEWLFFKTGEGATNHFESAAFVRSQPGVEYPDIQYHFLPVAIRYDGKAAAQSHGFQAHVGPMRSKSRGSVTLRNANPREKPVIRFNYMSHTDDWADFRHCVRLTREIFGQPAFDPYRGAEIQPGAGVQTDDEIDAFIRDHAESAFHPCGTCRMGAVDDPMSVVDPECRVIGVEALRVADSSIFPRITNGNLNGPSIMVGEKASDHILGRTPLARSNQEPWINPRWQVSDR